MNMNNQATLYKHGMTPVFRLAGNPHWARLKQRISFEENGRYLQLQFQFRFTRDLEEVFFAYCFPHSYEDCQRDLDDLEDQARRSGMAVQPLLTPKPGPTGYFHRELLIRTAEGRRIDLITVTDCHGISDEREPRINEQLFPDLPSRRRPLEFVGKDVVFVSARVHPGETPASFVMQGILRFLLDPIDPRSAELRRRFVFKIVPLLNPDGVAAGHFRQDSYGNNLNRHYGDPHPEIHAPVFGAKSVVMHHAAQPKGRGKLTLYLDLHAHASARGCFMYGNHLPGLEDQAENQLLPLLMTLTTPHFDFASCNFSLKHMYRVDSGDDGLSAEGTGRVFYGRNAGVLRSYTLECNYNTGKAMCNHIPPSHGRKEGDVASPERKQTSPPKYHPDIWRDVGRGFLKALLDAEGVLVWSRLPLSKFRTLDRARRYLMNELRSQPAYREQSLLLRRGAASAASAAVGQTSPRPQHRPPFPPASANHNAPTPESTPSHTRPSPVRDAGTSAADSTSSCLPEEAKMTKRPHAASTVALELHTGGVVGSDAPPARADRSSSSSSLLLLPERRGKSHPPLLPRHPSRRTSAFASNTTSSPIMRTRMDASPRQILRTRNSGSGSSSSCSSGSVVTRLGHRPPIARGVGGETPGRVKDDQNRDGVEADVIAAAGGIDDHETERQGGGGNTRGGKSGDGGGQRLRQQPRRHRRVERSMSLDAGGGRGGSCQRRETRANNVKTAAAGGRRGSSSSSSSSSRKRTPSRSRRRHGAKSSSDKAKVSGLTPRRGRDDPLDTNLRFPEGAVGRRAMLMSSSTTSAAEGAVATVVTGRQRREHPVHPQRHADVLQSPQKTSTSAAIVQRLEVDEQQPGPGWE
ncbi:unnamed protein product [Sphacelaria rigidula]